MKRKFINGFLMLALMVTAVGSFVSCKDYDEDMYVDLRGRITKEASLRELLQQQVNDLEAYVKTLKSCQCDMSEYVKKGDYDFDQIAKNKAAIELLQKAIDEINDKLAKLEKKHDDDIADLLKKISDMNSAIEKAQATANEALELAKKGGCDCDLSKLEDAIKKLQEDVAGWNDKLKEVEELAQSALTLAQKDSILIAANRKTIDSLINVFNNHSHPGTGTPATSETIYVVTKDTVVINQITKDTVYTIVKDTIFDVSKDTIYNFITNKDTVYNFVTSKDTINIKQVIRDTVYIEIPKDLTDLLKRLSAIEKDYVTKKQLDSAINKAKQFALDADTLAMKAMQKALDDSMITVNTKIYQLEQRLDTLVGRKEFTDSITKLTTSINNLVEKVTVLDKQVTDLKSDINQFITGIIIQGTKNPLLGFLNLPADIRTNMLVAYWGESSFNDYMFPSKWTKDDAPEFFVDAINEPFTERQLNIMGAFKQEKIEGGKRFLSDGERAYAGKVFITINPNNIDFAGKNLELVNSRDQAAGVTLTSLKRSNEELNFGYTRSNNGFYEMDTYIEASNIDKLNLKIDKDDILSKAKTALKNKSAGSLLSAGASFLSAINYDVPALALKASWKDNAVGVRSVYSQYGIAAATFKPLSYNTLQPLKGKTITLGKKQIYKLISKITDKVKEQLPTFTRIEFVNIGQVSPTSTVDVYAIYDDKNEVTVKVQLTADEVKTFNALINDINHRYGEGSPTEDAMGQIADAFDKVNDMLEAEKYEKYVDKVYDKLNSYFSVYAYQLFDVALIAKQGKNMGLASWAETKPLALNAGTVEFIPTSYTLELFAPAYRKFVAITNVWQYNPTTKTWNQLSEEEAKAKADAATGNNMKTVLKGTPTVTMTGEKNYMYEISYAAVDYNGFSTCNEFYVRFK